MRTVSEGSEIRRTSLYPVWMTPLDGCACTFEHRKVSFLCQGSKWRFHIPLMWSHIVLRNQLVSLDSSCEQRRLIKLSGCPGWWVFDGRKCHFVEYVLLRIILHTAENGPILTQYCGTYSEATVRTIGVLLGRNGGADQVLNVFVWHLLTNSEDWSDWADAQADLSLRWTQRSFCWFCPAPDYFTYRWKQTHPHTVLRNRLGSYCTDNKRVPWQQWRRWSGSGCSCLKFPLKCTIIILLDPAR